MRTEPSIHDCLDDRGDPIITNEERRYWRTFYAKRRRRLTKRRAEMTEPSFPEGGGAGQISR